MTVGRFAPSPSGRMHAGEPFMRAFGVAQRKERRRKANPAD